MTGRYAPSPTSELHLGNLRTAVVAWLLARSAGQRFVLRIDDLDQARVAAAPGVARQQLADLVAVGIDWDGEPVWQSARTEAYAAAVDRLPTYECYCTRREIAEAAAAPHDDGYRPYPGTCRDLSEAERARRRRERPPALRVRADGAAVTVHDRWAGDVTGVVDDVVVRRNDGTYAYNLATVVDDGAAQVTEVCRGDDLLSSSPRQAWLAARLGIAVPGYAHVGLVTDATGRRLAKRDAARSLAQLRVDGIDVSDVIAWIATSLGIDASHPRTARDLLRGFDPERPVPPVVAPAFAGDGASF